MDADLITNLLKNIFYYKGIILSTKNKKLSKTKIKII